MKKDKVYKFYSDNGHGWLAVKTKELFALNIQDKISSCSYVKGETTYLEEDCDSYTFFKAYEAIYGTVPKYNTTYINGFSAIRSYDRYKKVS